MIAFLLALTAKQDFFANPAFQITVIDGDYIVGNANPDEQILFESEQFRCSKVSEPSGLIVTDNPLSVKAKAIDIINELPCLEYVFDKTWVYTFCDGEITQQFASTIRERFKNDPENLKIIKESKYLLGVVDRFNDEELKTRLDGSFYLKKYLIDGDYCSKIGANRAVIVNYLCGTKSDDYISSVVEFSVCMYRITVRAKGLCQLPSFNPPTPAVPGTIQCIRKNGELGTNERVIGPDFMLIDYGLSVS